jgi:hypothetical protein
MMASMLLGIGATAVFSGWSGVMAVVEHQRRMVEGMNLARSQLERLLAAPAGASILGQSMVGPFAQDAFGQEDNTGAAYRVVAEIRQNRPGPGFIEIEVTTTWTESRGEFKTKILSFRER